MHGSPHARIVLRLALAGQLTAGLCAAQTDCSTIYPAADGWAIDLCREDASFPERMEVLLDGGSEGLAAMVRVYHETEDQTALPQVAIFNASGFVRLKQNADPVPPIPFGASFILGPAYWADSILHHSPSLAQLEIDTGGLPTAPLRLLATGVNGGFDAVWEMALPPPRDRQTRLHVLQSYTATEQITVDAGRVAAGEGFKLVQVSSMYVNEGSGCDGGHSDCHDVDGARFVGADGERRQVALVDLVAPGFVFDSPSPLSSTWLDALHDDDQSWQGNTPNVRIALEALRGEPERTFTPQGWLEDSTDPNDDNLALWLHDDDPEAHAWAPGESGEIAYWLLAQDDPPEPWSDLGLRTGTTLLDMEGGENCFFVHDAGQGTSGEVAPIAGYGDRALELRYDLATADGNWAQIRCDFEPPLDLSLHDHLRFDWRGDAAGSNSLQVALMNRTAEGEDRIFARGFHHASHRSWWGRMVLPFRFLEPWTTGSTFDPSRVTGFFVSVVMEPVDDTGGAGAIAVDEVAAWNVENRTAAAPRRGSRSRAGEGAAAAAELAAAWLASQQQPTGLLKSWEQEPACVAHTYDQALALLVFLDAGRESEAEALVGTLVSIQNPGGSWFKSRDCLTLAPLDANEWHGDIAWAIVALNRYLAGGGAQPGVAAARDAGAAWLVAELDPENGCLQIDHTEGTIDAWWALATAGQAFECPAKGLEECLLRDYWDPAMGRFKGGRDWWQPYLDNQTWGGAFLQAIGRDGDALRALSYAREVLPLPAQGGQLHGFDGQGGPWSVWNEGGGQYAAVGGADGPEIVLELLAQQRDDGALPGSPDEFAGGGVWTTRWYGVAPTSWLYFALAGSPFPAVPPGPQRYRLDLTETTLDAAETFTACDSIFAGPDLTVAATADVTLEAGRRVVFVPEVSAAMGARLSVAVGSP